MEENKTLNQTLPKILGDFAQSESILFCAPAHKQTGLGGFFQEQLAKWDIKAPEQIMYGGVEDSLASTRQNYNLVYHSAFSFFVTGGVSSAVSVMVDSLDDSDSVLLDSETDLYASYAFKRRGMKQSFLKHQCSHLSVPTVEEIEKGLMESKATVVYLSYPNPFGFCADLEKISYIVRKHHALLMVNGAYSSHFPFSKQFPDSVMQYADIWCHAPYYSLNALTQSTVIHLNDCRIKEKRLFEILTHYQDDMPSFVLLSSLDWALHLAKREQWDSQISTILRFSDSISSISGMRILNLADCSGAYAKDPLRIAVDVKEFCSGIQFREKLANRHIYVENADDSCVLLLCGTEDQVVWYPKCLDVMNDICMQFKRKTTPVKNCKK